MANSGSCFRLRLCGGICIELLSGRRNLSLAVHCAVYCTLFCLLYTVNCTIHSVRSKLYTVRCTLYTVRYLGFTRNWPPSCANNRGGHFSHLCKYELNGRHLGEEGVKLGLTLIFARVPRKSIMTVSSGKTVIGRVLIACGTNVSEEAA